jgi:ubiquinone/menaquinone biosynthesis C-methylase UbiE
MKTPSRLKVEHPEYAGTRKDVALKDSEELGDMALLLPQKQATVSIGQGTRSRLTANSGLPQPIWSGTVPSYLQDNYWWAYVHPAAVRFWERQWLVNCILFGNLVKLRDAALDELGQSITGRTLQVACVYGDFSVRFAERIAPGSTLDVVDVLPVQLNNLRSKLPASSPVTLHHSDSTALGFSDATFDQVVVFFLLHEQPDGVRQDTLREALRVTMSGGKLVVVDYHRPRWNSMRVLFEPILRFLEPFAPDLWHHQISEWLPKGVQVKEIRKQTFFGGLYQKVTITL